MIASRMAAFTLVELLACLVLVGILAVTILSRFGSSTTFDAAAARNQIVAMARIAQQAAIGHRDVVFSLQPAGNELALRIEAAAVDVPGTQVLQAVSVPARGLAVGGDVNNSQSCGAQPAALLSAPLQLTFAYPGRLASGGVGSLAAITNGARICINADPALSVCLSSAGFAYIGDCDAEG